MEDQSVYVCVFYLAVRKWLQMQVVWYLIMESFKASGQLRLYP